LTQDLSEITNKLQKLDHASTISGLNRYNYKKTTPLTAINTSLTPCVIVGVFVLEIYKKTIYFTKKKALELKLQGFTLYTIFLII